MNIDGFDPDTMENKHLPGGAVQQAHIKKLLWSQEDLEEYLRVGLQAGEAVLDKFIADDPKSVNQRLMDKQKYIPNLLRNDAFILDFLKYVSRRFESPWPPKRQERSS